jgi:Fe-S cluster assembly iron-binding protein IscA
MITLTDNAVAQIRKLEADKATDGQRLRIFVEAGGCSGFEYGMSFDAKIFRLYACLDALDCYPSPLSCSLGAGRAGHFAP